MATGLDVLLGGSDSTQNGLDVLLGGSVPQQAEFTAPPTKVRSWGDALLRQGGLTARYAMEGLGGIPQILGSAMQAVGVPGAGRNMGTAAADYVGLPSPETPQERVVGDVSRTMAGAALPVGLSARVADVATGIPKTVATMLSSNPVQQLASAGAAGGAGGYTRETGGDDGAQLAASLAAGIATPFAMNKATSAASSLYDSGKRLLANASSNPNITINVAIENALKPSGMTLDQLPKSIQAGLREDVAQAFKLSNGNLSPDSIRRLADYRLTNTTPTAAGLTLDPATVTQQKNLSKLGINSKDLTAQQLGQTENANNRQLISGLNDLGANTTDDALAGGQKVISALGARNDRAKSVIDQSYSQARATDGRSAALDPAHFSNTANNLLDDALLGGKLPADVRGLLNKAATGDMPLTVDVAEQLKTRIGDLQRASSDAAERKALGLVRQSLDSTPLLPGQEIGQGSIDAFNRARAINKSWMDIVEKTPALQAVRDGVEPDKFVQTYIIGNGTNSNVMDVAALKNSIKGSPDAMQSVKDQIVASLKKSALSGAEDETGRLSQSAYNKAIKAIGDRKLGLFFSSEELNQLKAIGRVASYEQFQPAGAAVNNSNTAGTGLAALLDRIGNSSLLSKIPFGGQIAQPIQNISLGMQSQRALNVPQAMAGTAMPLPQLGMQGQGLLMSPMIFAQPTDKERRRSLLSP